MKTKHWKLDRLPGDVREQILATAVKNIIVKAEAFR